MTVVRLHTTIDLEAVMNLSSLLRSPEPAGTVEASTGNSDATSSVLPPELDEAVAQPEIW